MERLAQHPLSEIQNTFTEYSPKREKIFVLSQCFKPQTPPPHIHPLLPLGTVVDDRHSVAERGPW